MSIERKKAQASLIFVGLILLVVVGAWMYPASAGWIVWRSTHAASIATALNKTDPRLFFEIGNYYYGEGAYDTAKAERYFRRALDLDQSLAGPHYQLARIYFVQGSFHKALDEIDTEIKLHPEFGRSHYVKGLILGYSGRLLDAEREFKAFLEWKPESWAGNNDLAWVYFQQGKYEEARDTALAGLAIAPTNPWLLNALGVSLLNIGDKSGAKEAFVKALAVMGSMTKMDWGKAYPGNDPVLYAEGFAKMRESIEENLRLLDSVDSNKPAS